MIQVQHNSGPTILIGIPTLGRPIPLNWAFAFKSLNPPINYNTVFHVINGAAIADARNEMVKQAIEKGCKYIFFLGDDVVVPNHTLRSLIYRMEHDPALDVTGGVYCVKAEPCYPLVFRGFGNGSYWDWKIGEYFEVTGLGMDCTLLRVDTLKKIPYPWFKTVDDDTYLDAQNHSESWTEDLFFFKKLADIGGKATCDATVICEHWDVYNNKAYTLPLDSLPMRQRVMAKTLRSLIIGESLELDEVYESIHFGEHEKADYRGQIGQLPFDKDEFDKVIVDSAPFCFENYIEEWLRVLKQDGKLLMNFPCPWINLEQVKDYVKKYGISKTYNNCVEIRKCEN